MATDDKELHTLEDQVTKLRERVEAERAKREEREAGAVGDIRKAELLAEKARLEAQLAQEQASNKVSAVKEGANAPLEAAVADQKHAEAARDAVTDN